jgi:hypothetical protein
MTRNDTPDLRARIDADATAMMTAAGASDVDISIGTIDTDHRVVAVHENASSIDAVKRH